MLTQEQVHHFCDHGYLVVENVLTEEEVETLRGAVEQIERKNDREDISIKWSHHYASTIFNLPMRPGPLSRVLQYRPVLSLIEQLVGEKVRVTGGLLLDKDPQNNWDIGWHQDTGIYVAAIPPGEPEDIRGGFPVYRTKGLELSRTVTCRIALDPSTAESGGLYVLPGSHRTNLGKGEDVKRRFAHEKGVLAYQLPGSALFYCPLTLHRSEKMTVQERRRILHLKYSPADTQLPGVELYPWPQPCPLVPLDTLTS
jgi:ectoine hydroxylase-related dioxygenase (phytanoyl-CoA dioxygenase family)